MTQQEFFRLRSFWICKKQSFQHRPLNGSKKHIKGVGKGVGLVTKQSWIKPQIKLMECN